MDAARPEGHTERFNNAEPADHTRASACDDFAGQACSSDQAGAAVHASSADLVRFSVAVPEDLLTAFDGQTARRGTGANRSEAIRDLMRAALVKDELRTPTAQVIGSLTMIYDHHTRQLDEIQHDYTAEIVSTMHVHLDHHNCLEILAVRGQGARVYELADKLLGLRGVHHGELTCAATGASLER